MGGIQILAAKRGYMKKILSVVLLLAMSPIDVRASSRHEADMQKTHALVLKLSDLRSAYLIRGGGVQYNPRFNLPNGNRAQLQRHFDVVIGLLLVSTPQSIVTALNRLEAAEDHRWSNEERTQWTNRLLTARYVQLQRLAYYRDRGRFPQNEGQADHAVPIFVDAHNTACAVGQLMRWSGWETEVAAIHAKNNLVYVPDVDSTGPIAKWALTSGLTLEEAALIQPSYGFVPRTPAIPDDAIDAIASNWSGVVDDVRLSNFRLIRSSGSQMTDVNIPVSHNVSCSLFCVAPFQPLIVQPLQPIGSFKLNLDTQTSDQPARTETSASSNGYPNPSDDSARILIEFDVETTSPTMLLATRPYAASLQTYFGEEATYGRNEVGLFLSDDASDLLFDHRTSEFYYSNIGPHNAAYDALSFTPTRKMTVVTELLLNEGRPSEAQLLHFDIVTIPEPGGFVLFIVGCAALRARTHRRRSMGR